MAGVVVNSVNASASSVTLLSHNRRRKGAAIYNDSTDTLYVLFGSGTASRRVNRIFVLTAGSGGENAGAITCRSTTTTANVFGSITAGYNQTQIACWTVPASQTAYLKRVRISAARASGAAGSAQVTLRVREPGGVYRSIRVYDITTAHGVNYTALGGIALAAGSDLKTRVESVSDNNTQVEAALEFLIVED